MYSQKRATLCRDRGAIQSYSRDLERQLKTLPRRTFARLFSDQDKDWHEVEGDYEGIVAHVFFQADQPVAVAFGNSSESGDWAQDVTYYYRRDGTLAAKYTLLNTFYGNASVRTRTTYSCSGAVLSKQTQHLNLKTKKPKPPDPEFVDEPSPEYKRVAMLPFFHQLSKPRPR